MAGMLLAEIAATSADAFVANQMKSLAQAFRAQAEIMNRSGSARPFDVRIDL